MPDFYGRLTVGQKFSLIETQAFPSTPRKYWLVRGYDDEFEDLELAASNATEYIQEKGLDTGMHVIVTGFMVALGSQPLIDMSDINAADLEMANAYFESLNVRRTAKARPAQKKSNARKRSAKKARAREKQS